MRYDLVTLSSVFAVTAVAIIGGVSGLIALLICGLMVGLAGADSAEKHGISEVLSSRLGGLIVLVYLLVNTCYLVLFANYSMPDVEVAVLACASFFYLVGVVEDVTGAVSAKLRFLLMFVGALILAISSHKLRLSDVGISWVDWVVGLSTYFAVIFTTICMVFLTNACNTADGANGLMGGVGFAALATLGLLIPSPLGVLQMSTSVGCLIFLLFNIYTGRFFLGDGGAYAIGAVLGCSLVYLSNVTDVSAWFLVSLVFYPSADLIWSIARRAVTRHPITAPDNHHFHNLLYERLRQTNLSAQAANNATGLMIVTIFCLFPIFLAVSKFLPLYQHGWSYVVYAQWLLYTTVWFTLKRIASV